jgi:hypothetical protein
MYISTPDNSMSQSKMYVKSRKSTNSNTGVCDWDNMTSSTNIKMDDGTGIFPRRGLPQGPSPELKLTHYIYKIEKTAHSTAWSLHSVQPELVLDGF